MTEKGAGTLPDVDQVEGENRPLQVRNDHYCVGCGHLNPHGLKLTFFEQRESGVIWADWTPVREQEGYAGIAHGGMITTVLDEVMGWAVSHRRIWAVTGRLSVAFRRPVEIGVPVRASAWIVRDYGRKLDVAASLVRRTDGTPLAEATGVFVRVPPATAAEWQARYLDADGERDQASGAGSRA